MKTFRTTAQFAILVTLSSQAQADWTASLGFASEYYYRGIFQDTSKTKGPKKGALQFLARPERLTGDVLSPALWAPSASKFAPANLSNGRLAGDRVRIPGTQK